jgi:hypothetical protein
MSLACGLTPNHVALVLAAAMLLFGGVLPPGGTATGRGRGPKTRHKRRQKSLGDDVWPKEGE